MLLLKLIFYFFSWVIVGIIIQKNRHKKLNHDWKFRPTFRTCLNLMSKRNERIPANLSNWNTKYYLQFYFCLHVTALSSLFIVWIYVIPQFLKCQKLLKFEFSVLYLKYQNLICVWLTFFVINNCDLAIPV